MTIRPETLLRPMPGGLYCPAGDFWIDPTRAVARAIVHKGQVHKGQVHKGQSRPDTGATGDRT